MKQRSRFEFLRTLLGLAVAMVLFSAALMAQSGGEGSINGTVTDATGAVIPNAKIVITNTATGAKIERTSSGDGIFIASPLPVGVYSVRVTMPNFKTLEQDNLQVNALSVLAYTAVLNTGEAADVITVSAAPPVLDTATATLGTVMENETYANLPLQVNGAQRDPTAFAALTPGAQAGARAPIVGGTGNYLGQVYLDGLPAETVSQQGDNRLISLAVSLDAVEQFQVLTSTPPAEYQGAGAMNFTMKSGARRYHGQASDFVRNTIFDAWCFTCKAATVKNAAGQTVPAPKPFEHQNELSLSFSGKVPFTHEKLFFFFAYDKFHQRAYASPSLFTVPTALMQAGDFTELNVAGGTSGTTGNPAVIYDPTSNACVGAVCTRTPFQGIKNGLPTNNVIPSSYLSPIAKAMQSFLPAPTIANVTTNNYLGSINKGFDNHVINTRLDYDLSGKHRISALMAMGTVNYLNNYGTPYIPGPYVGGDLANIYPKDFDVEDTYSFSDRLTNQFKYGYVRFFQNIQDATQGVTAWQANTLGITNLPAGQAAIEFPGAQFGTTAAYGTVQTTWTGYSNAVATQLTTPNNFTIVDNLAWLKGKHALTFGFSIQWQQINNANPATYTGVLDLAYNAYSTGNYSAGSNALTTGTATAPSGYSYASYLLGAVGGTPSIGLQPISEEGGRYRPISPYVEDSYKISKKLTLDLGLRWDYLPPFHEVKDHWTYMNPNLMNAATGTPGMLEFAGNYGGAGVSCGCRTPVQTYWKNWGPRVGIAYAVTSKTVIRAGFGQVYSQGGGVGGRAGAFNGTGQTGFNTTATGAAELTSGIAAGPSFYLNNGTTFTTAGLANTSLFGAGYVYPANPTPNAAAQLLNTGNYLNSAGKLVTAAGVSVADPYLSGRAPTFSFFNLGVQREITKDMTLSLNYVGNQSHFLVNSTATGANARGYWVNQLNPIYLAGLGGITDSTATKPILNAAATPANVAKAQAAMAGVNVPTFFQTAATANPSSSALTIAQGLTAFPQYSGVTDTWGTNVGNFSYNSLQVTLSQRTAHGLTFNVNYVYSKNLGDDGTFRSGFDIPQAALSQGKQSWKQDRIERGWTTIASPHVFHAYGVYKLPFGKGQIGGNSWAVRAFAGGWSMSGIYTYTAGTPVAVTWSGCTATTYPGQGQCMPDQNASYPSKSARINGGYGSGPNGVTFANLGTSGVKYIDSTAFSTPTNVSATSAAQYLLGNAPRTHAFGLSNPASQNLDASVRRTIALPLDIKFVFEVDCLNVMNHVVFASPSAAWASGSTSFGTIAGIATNPLPRDFQLAAHLNF